MKGKQITQRKCSKMFCFTVPDFSPKFSLPQNGWFLCILRIFTQYRAPEYLDLSTQARVQVELNLRRAPSLFLLALWSARIWEGFFGLFHACLYIYIWRGLCFLYNYTHAPQMVHSVVSTYSFDWQRFAFGCKHTMFPAHIYSCHSIYSHILTYSLFSHLLPVFVSFLSACLPHLIWFVKAKSMTGV